MENHVCPWWLGYLLASPVRKIIQNPEKILRPYVKEGMTVLDAGSAMGYYSLPMAEMVGTGGKVISVDLQKRMLRSLEKRARKKGIEERIVTRQCTSESLNIEDLSEQIDFALAFAVVHEVPDKNLFFSQIYDTLKKNCILLFAEPSGHVSGSDFKHSIEAAEQYGFKSAGDIIIGRSLAVLLEK